MTLVGDQRRLGWWKTPRIERRDDEITCITYGDGDWDGFCFPTAMECTLIATLVPDTATQREGHSWDDYRDDVECVMCGLTMSTEE